MTDLDFENSLRKGLGRCVLALNNPDNLVRYKEIVLNCCLRSVSSYTNIEKSRGTFLYSLVKKFNDDDYFLDPVIEFYDKLEAGEGISDGKMQQMTDFLWCFCGEKNIKAYESIKNKFSEIKSFLCSPSVDVNALMAFEMLGYSFIENDGFSGYMRVIQAVDAICIENINLNHKDFEDILCSKCDVYQHKRILKEVSLNASRKMHMYFYRLFQMYRVPEKKPPRKAIVRFFPDLDEVRLDVVQIIQQERLFDENHVLAVCKKIITLHEAKQQKRVPKDLLSFVYENSPSAYIRSRAVHFMGKKKMITPDIAEECLYDCDEYIRNYVKQYQRHRLS